MDEAIKAKLTEMFGNFAVSAAESLYPAYGAVVARFTFKEALALEAYLNAKKYAEAQSLLRSRMTTQELADEKTKLAELTFEAALENSQQWSLATEALKAGLKVLLAAALVMVGL